MRSTMLATLVSYFGWAAVSCLGIEVGSVSAPEVASSAFALPGSEINTPTITPAANFQVAEVEVLSPSDRLPTPAKPLPDARIAPTPQPDTMHTQHSMSPHQLPYAPGPSGVSHLLRYMNCDPHSCPNIWQGYDAQRAAELAAKCAPPGGGCGCCRGGCGACGGLQLYPSPCIGGGVDCAKPINRYRKSAPTCSGGCDSCTIPGPTGEPCSSCQAMKPAPTSVSTAAVPTDTRR